MANIYLYSNDLFLQDIIAQLSKKINCDYTLMKALDAAPTNSDICIIDMEALPNKNLEQNLISMNINGHFVVIADKLSKIHPFKDRIDVLYKPISIGQLEQLCLKLLHQQQIPFANHILEEQTSTIAIIEHGSCIHRIRLTAKEFGILSHLACGGTILTKGEILKRVFGYQDAENTHTFEVHISRLNQKLAPYIELNNFIRGIS